MCEDFQNALQDENASVIFVGHSAGGYQLTDAGESVYSANGLMIGAMTGDDTISYLNATSTVEVKASLVAVFGCDTKSISGLFQGASSYIGVDGGKEGYTGAPAIAQAGYAAASAVVAGKGPDQVTAQANSALLKNSGEITKQFGSGRNRFNVTTQPDRLFNGDHVVRVR